MATRFKKVLGRWDLLLFTVCAILVLDTVPSSAAMGMQTFFWWVVTLFLFFIPYGMITAELGSAIPNQGGMYVWIRRAFGDTAGSMASWLYWINVAYWMPSVYVLFAGTFASLFFPKMSTWGQIGIAIIMVWLTVYFGILSLGSSKHIPNIGAIAKVVVLLFLGVIGIWSVVHKGFANPFSVRSLFPSWSDTLGFLPVVVYNYMGFELMSSAGEEMKNPKKDVPRAIFIAGALIFFFYVIGSWGILASLPLDKISIVTGIIDSIKTVMSNFGATTGGIVTTIFGIIILYTFFANMVTWSIGANRMIAATATEGNFPKIMGHLNKRYATPDMAYIITGIVGTLLLIGNGLLSNSSANIFWTIFALSSLVFLLPYLLLFPAFLKLRKTEPNLPRPYRVPGGNKTAWILAILCEFFVAIACIFFFQPTPDVKNVFSYEAQLIIVTILTVLVGYVLYKWSIKRYKKSGEVSQ
ncbi:MAG: APC family permease [Caldisericaceae bacterium]|nr:APC family permease [Caldisericaceae bacterium]